MKTLDKTLMIFWMNSKMSAMIRIRTKKLKKKITVADEKYLLKLEKQMSSDLEESRSVFCLQLEIKWFPSAMQDCLLSQRMFLQILFYKMVKDRVRLRKRQIFQMRKLCIQERYRKEGLSLVLLHKMNFKSNRAINNFGRARNCRSSDTSLVC